MPQDTINFGPFTLSEAHGLVRDGRPVEMGQKALSILWALAKADGHSVSKDKLMDACWPGLVVEESNLSVQIAALRKALGAADGGPDWIVTVPRFGYRLPKRADGPAPGQEEGVSPRSIAVVPFRNLSANQENDYFAAGLSAEITGALARYKSLIVHAGHESAGDARTRAAMLGVKFLVEGQAMRRGDELRVVASLIDGERGAVMWNQRFDASMTDIFAVQDQIAATVAAHVEPAISDQEIARARRRSPLNPSAYELYLRARHLQLEGSEQSLLEAFALLQKALRQDPDDPQATGMICEILLVSVASGFPPFTADDRKLGEHYARRCIEIADGDARVLARAAVALLHMTSDLAGTLAVSEQAYGINPNDWEVANIAATVQLHCGDLEIAIERYERAIRMGPVSAESRCSRTGLAHAMIVLGQFDKAIACASDSIAVSSGFSITYWMLIAANAHAGRIETAKGWLDAMSAKWSKVTVSAIRAGQPKFKPERIEPILRGLAMAGMPEV